MNSLKIKNFLFLFISLFIGATSNAQNYIGKKKHINQILQQTKMFSKYLVAGDTDKLVACYTADGKIFPSDTDIIQGSTALYNFWKTPKESKIIKHKVTPVEIKVVKETAFDFGYYQGTTLTSKGKEISWKGKYVILWKKIDKKWKIYIDIWTPIIKKKETISNQLLSKNQINQLLEQWHQDVATFKYKAYFDKMTQDAIFVGTDASEVWSKQEFQTFCKPFFDKKSTWNFKPIKRNVYLDKKEKTAWFDETLDTWMGVCRGSGVLAKQNNQWKIKHYVLSIVIPNDNVKEIVKIKQKLDDTYLKDNK